MLNFPPSPVIGQQVNGYTWDGQKWVCGSGGGTRCSCGQPGWFSPIVTSASAPSDKPLWFNTSTSILTVWNSTTSQWTAVSTTIATGASPPVAPVPVGQLWIDATSVLWCWNGFYWLQITQGVPGMPVPTGTLPLVVASSAPAAPAVGLAWLNPFGPILSWFQNGAWLIIGTRPLRLVEQLSPPNAPQPFGPASIASRSGDLLHIGGIRGINPVSNLQLDPTLSGAAGTPTYGLNRVQQCFTNLLAIAQSQGATQWDIIRLGVYVTNMALYAPLVNQTMQSLWGNGPYPPRSVLGVVQLEGADTQVEGTTGLPRGDICMIEGTFYRPCVC